MRTIFNNSNSEDVLHRHDLKNKNKLSVQLAGVLLPPKNSCVTAYKTSPVAVLWLLYGEAPVFQRTAGDSSERSGVRSFVTGIK